MTNSTPLQERSLMMSLFLDKASREEPLSAMMSLGILNFKARMSSGFPTESYLESSMSVKQVLLLIRQTLIKM